MGDVLSGEFVNRLLNLIRSKQIINADRFSVSVGVILLLNK